MRERGTAVAIAIYTAALGLAALCLAAAGGSMREFRGTPWWVLPALVVLMVAAARLVLRVGYRDQVMALDLFETALVPAIVFFPVPVAILAAVLGQAGAEYVNRNDRLKAIFNVAQWGVATGAGSIAYAALVGRAQRFDEGAAGAVVVALVVVASVNMFAFAFVLRLAQRRWFWGIVEDLIPSISMGWMVNTAFGLLLVTSLAWSPLALILFIVPLVLLHRACRGYAAAHADRARLRGLHAATHALNARITPDQALGAFLGEVRRCFDAGAALLILGTADERILHVVDERGYRSFVDRQRGTVAEALLAQAQAAHIEAGADGAVADAIAAEGWRDCLTAPLLADGRTLGMLCAVDRSGPESFEEAELSILRALASEAANSLRRAMLFDEIVEERAKLAEIVGRTSDGICTIDAEGRLMTWNPGFESITGYHEQSRNRILDLLRARDGLGAPVDLTEWPAWLDDPTDLEIVTVSGERRSLACSYTRVADPDGKPVLLIVIARDVTAQREVDKLKEDFIATVSHELRTPLTPIIGWARMLERGADRLSAGDRAVALTSIVRQAEHLQALISDLLDVTTIERRLDVRPLVPVDVREIIDATVYDYRAANTDREIIARCPESILAMADHVWIRQVLSNIVSNAIKYSPANKAIEVVARREKGSVAIDVVDRGPGIPLNEQERIFERFHRLGDHMTREQGGTGLGLYIARSLATAMGGSLGVKSSPGRGATFTLRLAAATGSVHDASPPDETALATPVGT